MSLAAQKVVVIGGTSGIGLAVAQAAAADGAQVVVASSNENNVKEALNTLPDSAAGHRLDATDEDAVRAFFAGVGEFDHLAYTAGDYLTNAPVAELSLEQARATFEVRYFGAFLAAKHAAATLRPTGSMTFTSGIIVARPAKGVAPSASAAGAVETLARALAVELAPVRVNTVRLGPFGRKAQSSEQAPQTHDREALYQAVAAKLLTGRMGRHEQAAAAYVYLMGSGFTTGTVLVPDGGYTLV
jgi:NAD(P)-dependent dehydrogenase (short-subunit alcohol dehydrogenase family)